MGEGRELSSLALPHNPKQSTMVIDHNKLEPPAWAYVRMARTRLFGRVYRRFAAELAGALAPGARVLDVGTGPGYLLAHLARERPDLQLIGMDLSYRMIHGGREAAGLKIQRLDHLVGDAQALPFPEGVFDQVAATFTFHTWKDRQAGVAEVWRVLKRGGQAWIYELNREAPISDLRNYAREEKLPFLLTYLGFKLTSLHHALKAAAFAPVFREAGVTSWRLEKSHNLFWRAEIIK